MAEIECKCGGKMIPVGEDEDGFVSFMCVKCGNLSDKDIVAESAQPVEEEGEVEEL